MLFTMEWHEAVILGSTPIRSCCVAILDMDGVEHTVQVSASTLYEAVALALASLHGDDWVWAILPPLRQSQGRNFKIPRCASSREDSYAALGISPAGSRPQKQKRFDAAVDFPRP